MIANGMVSGTELSTASSLLQRLLYHSDSLTLFFIFFNILFLFCVQISINNKTNKEILNQTKKDVISLLDKKTREFMASQIKISRFSHTEQSLLDKMPQLLYRKHKA